MPDTLRKVQPGDRLRIPAATFNAFVDSAIDLRSRQQSRNQQATPQHRDSGIILVRNKSEEDCPRFGILAIDQPIIAPDAGEEFKNRVAIDGVKPLDPDHLGKFVILLEPAKIDQIVSAMIVGVCAAKIIVDDEAHRYADIDDENVAELRSGVSGGARILWKEAGTGTKWAIVQVGIIAPVSMFPVKVWQDGGSTDGSTTASCDRTYTVRTLGATSPTTEGVELGSALSPLKTRPPRGKLICPSSSGAGVVGLGYFEGSEFRLYDANETLDTEVC